MLLLAQSDNSISEIEYNDKEETLSSRLQYVKSVQDIWWTEWMRQVFDSLVPCRKWRKEVRNVMIGDIIMLRFSNQLKNQYKMGRIIDIHPDERGLVRSVTVKYRKKSSREKTEIISSKNITIERIGIQRIVIILPLEEQDNILPLEEQDNANTT